MKILTDKTKPLPQRVALSIGNFDGFHIGHHHLLKHLKTASKKADSTALVYTFSPHPGHVLNRKNKIKLICPQNELKNLITEADYLFIKSFTPSFSRVRPEDFLIRYIIKPFSPKVLVLGTNFHFGKNKRGTVTLLKKICAQHKITLQLVQPLTFQEQPVSSSKVRFALEKGDLKLAKNLLGRDFSLYGTLIKGKGLGTKLGFPTLNLKIDKHSLLPPHGVYKGKCKTPDGEMLSVLNIGINPTVSSDDKIKVEVHVLKPLKLKTLKYKIPIAVKLLKWLRPEKKFNSLQSLTCQIKKDINKCFTV